MVALNIALLGRGTSADDGTGDTARSGGLKINKNARLLEALAKGVVISATTTAQPASPSAGALYIIPSGKTGADWSGMTNGALALYCESDGTNAWFEITPAEGWRMYAQDSNLHLHYTGSAWIALTASLGLTIGADVLAYSALVQALAASAPSAGDLWYAASATTVSKQASTAFGRGALNLADAAALRTYAALGTAATQNTGTSGANVPLLNGDNVWSGAGNTFPNTGLKVYDTDASHALTLKPGSNITAARTLTIATGDANRSLDVSAADVTISAAAATVLDDTSVGAMCTTLGAAQLGAANVFTSTLTMANNLALQFKSSGGSTFAVLYKYTDDNIYFDQIDTGKDIIFRGPSYTEVMRVSGASRLQMATPIGLKSYTVAGLPAGSAADIAYASNGRKNGEGAGAGTGVMVFKDGTAWRACDTGATVAA